jgi:beta-aspartyl-peptidase (threonine type)
VLARGGSSLDAIEAVIHGMEDDPLFNAGRGAVFTAEGTNELDASIMDGATLKAGAVAGVTTVATPSPSPAG